MIAVHFRSPRLYLYTIIFVFTLACGSSSFAVDQDIRDFYPSAEKPPLLEAKRELEEDTYPQKKRLRITGFVDVQQGYDNNCDLDSKRHKDGFIQSTGDLEFIYEATDNLKVVAGSDIFNTIYYKYNINNILDVSPFLGFDLEIIPGLISRNRIKYDYFAFPNYKESTFSALVLTTYLRHYIVDDFYHEGGFEYLRRYYPDQITYLTNGQYAGDDRIDNRIRVKYTVGWFQEKFFFRMSNEFSRNDSNDLFQQYYDWWHYRLRPSLMYFFTEKLYTDVSLVYKYIHYKDRRSTDNINKKERDNNYIFAASMYYDLTKNLTLEVTYSYSQNNSNDPFQAYSGSIVTGGVSLSF